MTFQEAKSHLGLSKTPSRELGRDLASPEPVVGRSRRVITAARTVDGFQEQMFGAEEQVPVAAGKAANLVGERPMPSIARFGRLAYPMRGEVTNRAVLGRKRHGRPEHPIRMPSGGNDLGGSKLGGLKIIE